MQSHPIRSQDVGAIRYIKKIHQDKHEFLKVKHEIMSFVPFAPFCHLRNSKNNCKFAMTLYNNN